MKVWAPSFTLPHCSLAFLPVHTVLSVQTTEECIGKVADMERRLLLVELEEAIGVTEVPKEGVEVTETEEEASEMRMMRLHLGDARGSLTLMPKLS